VGGARRLRRCASGATLRIDAGGQVKRALVIVLACAVAPTCATGQSASEHFAADKPTPLKQLKPGKDDDNAVRFGGSVQLSAQFLVVWERVDGKPVFRQITLFPDAASAALLPRAPGGAPVTELFVSNREQAGPMLLRLPTVETELARGQTGAEGAAIVTIRDYRAVVECDQRRYLAQLASAKRDRAMLVSARNEVRPGC
jgi:hypothetical protein